MKPLTWEDINESRRWVIEKISIVDNAILDGIHELGTDQIHLRAGIIFYALLETLVFFSYEKSENNELLGYYTRCGIRIPVFRDWKIGATACSLDVVDSPYFRHCVICSG